jgi:hypothetical protein
VDFITGAGDKKPATRRVTRKYTPTASCAQQESSASSAVINGGLHPRVPKTYSAISEVSTEIPTQHKVTEWCGT